MTCFCDKALKTNDEMNDRPERGLVCSVKDDLRSHEIITQLPRITII